MLTLLFWNLGGNSPAIPQRYETLRVVIGNLARLHQVDLLILAESPLPPPDLLDVLNRDNPVPYEPADSASRCPRISIYPRFSHQFLVRLQETSRYTARLIRRPNGDDLLLLAVHLRSKLYRNEEDKTSELTWFGLAIRTLEAQLGHRRTLVIGDLNADPFESGVVKADGLHAVMTREIASRERRTVEGNEYHFFYNPMWSLFGDSTHATAPPGTHNHEPAGTYYRPATGFRGYFWHLFDQVLMRPALLPRFHNHGLRILVTDGEASFLDERGLPDRRRLSDHLPLLVCLQD